MAAATIKKKPEDTMPSDKPAFIPQDAQGKKYSIKNPDGTVIKDLSPDVAFSLRNSYKAPKLSEDEQIAADYARNQKAEAYAKSQEQPATSILNPNQQAKLGASLTGALDVQRDPITQDINKMNTAAQVASTDLMGVLPLNKFSGTLVKAVNKFTGGAGTDLVGIAPEPIKNYLNDYSNDDSFDKIKEQTGDAKATVDYALSLTRNPQTAVEGAELFETSIRRMRIGQAQLKLISQREGYNKDVDIKLIEINNYLEKIAPNKLREIELNLMTGG